MADKKAPPRRSDVIRCENCGEDYSVTYKRCPFCDERPGRGGKRVAGGGRSSGANPIQTAILIGSLVLIIAALYIIFTSILPMITGSKNDPGDASGDPGTSQVDPGSSQTPGSSQDPGSSQTPGSSQDPGSSQQPGGTGAVASLTLSESDFTLPANESHQIKATVSPEGSEVTWQSSDSSVATVSSDGTVTNVNSGTSKVKVTITATAGDKTAECTVYCNPGSVSSGGDSGSVAGKVGTITNAGGGLNIRSGPGSSYDIQASTANGAKVTILEDTGTGWYKISYALGGGKMAEGYVSKDYVTVGG